MPFIFEARDGIHIIDLAKTKEGLEEAAKYLKNLAKTPSATLLVVGTKRQADELLLTEIERVKKEIKGDSGLFFVTNKWIGGLLTNFSEVSKNFKKLTDFTHKLATPSEQEGFTKKEIGGWQKESHKLENLYGGVAKITKKPDALFIIDSHLEDLVVREALATHVPTVAIVDTNADPAVVDYPIPANDDAVGSISLIVNYIIDSWIEGRKEGAKQKEISDKTEEVKKVSKEAASAKSSGEPKEKAAKKETKSKTKKTKKS